MYMTDRVVITLWYKNVFLHKLMVWYVVTSRIKTLNIIIIPKFYNTFWLVPFLQNSELALYYQTVKVVKLLELVFVRILFHQCLKIDNSVSILKFLVFTFKFSLLLFKEIKFEKKTRIIKVGIQHSIKTVTIFPFHFKKNIICCVLRVLQRDLLLQVYLLMASSVLFLALRILNSYIRTISYMIFLMHYDFEVKKKKPTALSLKNSK